MPKRRSLRLAEKRKRREEETKGQEMEEGEVKRPRIVPSMRSLDFNPFLVEPILRKLLMKVDTVAQLKDLRKMCEFWDKVGVDELEERAFQGKVKAIDFQWTDRFKTKNEAVKELLKFMKDTRSIPQLFHFFKFNISDSLKILILQAHTSAFFSDYHIYGVDLMPDIKTLLYEFHVALKYFLSLIGPNLKDIKICQPTVDGHVTFEPKFPNWPKPQQKLILPKLEKLFIKAEYWAKDLTEFFKSALIGTTGAGHITSLVLTSLPGADIGSFPGLDPARMTRLDIGGGINGTSSARKYTAGLMALVEKGMKLLDLGLKLDSGDDDTVASYAQNLPAICSNLTHFFATQSSTLATLDLKLDFICTWTGPEDEIGAQVGTYGKIQLPVFQALHTLSFHHRLQMGIPNQGLKARVFSLIEPTHSLPLHYPSLVNLTFDSLSSMGLFFDNPGQMELAQDSRFHFKRLEIFDSLSDLERWSRNWETLYETLIVIGSVDYLRVPSEVLDETRIPWADSIRELSTEYVLEPLNVAHLKNLKILVIKDCRVQPTLREPIYGASFDSVHADKYLNWFKEAKQLSLEYIKFIGLETTRGVKQKFDRYFPYPVIFDN